MQLAPGGAAVAAVPAAAGVVLAAVGLWPAAAVGLVLAAVALGFYRDPERQPAGDGLVAPADGIVREIEETDGRLRLAVFLNLHDVHVVRSPAAGAVTGVERVDGHRRPAFLAGAARNAGVRVETEAWTAVLRAGVVAWRVRAYVDPGDVVDRGQRLGHIAFGSRVDLLLPPSVARSDLHVAVGDRVAAGETVIATGTPQ